MSSNDEGGKDRLSDLESFLREHSLDDVAVESEAQRVTVAYVRPSPESARAPAVGGDPRDVRTSRVVVDRDAKDEPRRVTPSPGDDAALPTQLASGIGSASPTRPLSVRAPLGIADSLRLDTLGVLGIGGMGEVHRVADAALGRVLAMKVLLSDLTANPQMHTRFVEEAQITAQLAHPAIPPVHQLGQLDDGRPYFTMKEVHGRTLSEVLRDVHGSAAGARASEATSARRLLEVFQRICEAVGYAHARGVVHCDLKPANVMVGAFGEVLVMDWGVAQLVRPSSSAGAPLAPVETVRSRTDEQSFVGGTIGYMAPEQAVGDLERLGPASDVFALGVILYELLAGKRPYRGAPFEVVALAKEGNIPPLPEGTIADEALFGIVCRALSPDPADRYPDAFALAEDVARWREGALRREKALVFLEEARAILPEITDKRAQAAALRAQADEARGALAPDADLARKSPIWAVEDRAAALEREAVLATVRMTHLLQAALLHAPDLVEAKKLLARVHFERHREAERARAWDEAAEHEVRLRADDVGEYADYLLGEAPILLATEVPCRVRLHEYVVRDRRLVAELVADFGVLDRLDRTLPIGSYVLELLAEGRAPVLYPIVLRRRQGWDGRRPGADAPFPIPLPLRAEIGEGEIYVPAGWFDAGGDERAPGAGPARRVWLDGFVVSRRPVTFRELARFLAAPEGAPFRDGVHRDGLELFRPDWPAVGVSWDAARAYAAWRSAQASSASGAPLRLPSELEWEKAARGVDGRLFPWGDFADGAFCHVRSEERVPRAPTSVEDVRADVSPYGVVGMGGNVREWCADPAGEGARVVRGGSFRQPLESARVAARSALAQRQGFPDLGFRLARSIGVRAGADVHDSKRSEG